MGKVLGRVEAFSGAKPDDGLLEVGVVQPGTPGFEPVLALAAQVLAQDRYLVSRFRHAQQSHVLGAFTRGRCVGFLRYLIQVIGAEAGRPPVMYHGQPLSEGYVEAFGVDPRHAAGASEPRCSGTQRDSAGSSGATRCVPAAR
jgi:hypothetical protein